MQEYECPCCHNNLLYIEENEYMCANLKCELKDATITIEEGMQDIFISDEETQEFKKERKWCTSYNIANGKVPVIF